MPAALKQETVILQEAVLLPTVPQNLMTGGRLRSKEPLRQCQQSCRCCQTSGMGLLYQPLLFLGKEANTTPVDRRMPNSLQRDIIKLLILIFLSVITMLL